MSRRLLGAIALGAVVVIAVSAVLVGRGSDGPRRPRIIADDPLHPVRITDLSYEACQSGSFSTAGPVVGVGTVVEDHEAGEAAGSVLFDQVIERDDGSELVVRSARLGHSTSVAGGVIGQPEVGQRALYSLGDVFNQLAEIEDGRVQTECSSPLDGLTEADALAELERMVACGGVGELDGWQSIAVGPACGPVVTEVRVGTLAEEVIASEVIPANDPDPAASYFIPGKTHLTVEQTVTFDDGDQVTFTREEYRYDDGKVGHSGSGPFPGNGPVYGNATAPVLLPGRVVVIDWEVPPHLADATPRYDWRNSPSVGSFVDGGLLAPGGFDHPFSPPPDLAGLSEDQLAALVVEQLGT